MQKEQKEPVTIDSILFWFKESTEKIKPISNAQWLDSAAKLNILAEDIDNQIDEMDFKMAEREREMIKEGESAVKAGILRTEVIDYKKYLELKSTRKRIDEHIRIAKIRQSHPDY